MPATVLDQPPEMAPHPPFPAFLADYRDRIQLHEDLMEESSKITEELIEAEKFGNFPEADCLSIRLRQVQQKIGDVQLGLDSALVDLRRWVPDADMA